jgi:hypothetical protein
MAVLLTIDVMFHRLIPTLVKSVIHFICALTSKRYKSRLLTL